MYSELVVIIEPTPSRMDEAWRALTESLGSQLFWLTEMTLIRRDRLGKASFEMRWQEADRLVKQHKQLAGGFAEAIFGQFSSNGHHRLIEAGMDPIFLQDVNEALKPNGWAYLFFVPAESRLVTKRFIDSLEILQGDLYHTTFSSNVEKVMLKRNDKR